MRRPWNIFVRIYDSINLGNALRLEHVPARLVLRDMSIGVDPSPPFYAWMTLSDDAILEGAQENSLAKFDLRSCDEVWTDDGTKFLGYVLWSEIWLPSKPSHYQRVYLCFGHPSDVPGNASGLGVMLTFVPEAGDAGDVAAGGGTFAISVTIPIAGSVAELAAGTGVMVFDDGSDRVPGASCSEALLMVDSVPETFTIGPGLGTHAWFMLPHTGGNTYWITISDETGSATEADIREGTTCAGSESVNNIFGEGHAEDTFETDGNTYVDVPAPLFGTLQFTIEMRDVP